MAKRHDTEDGALATVNTAIAADCIVAACCSGCQHIADLDLTALVNRGLGAVPLTRLPLRCAACGGNNCQVLVSGRAYRW